MDDNKIICLELIYLDEELLAKKLE